MKTKKSKRVLDAKKSKKNRDEAIERVQKGMPMAWETAAYLMARGVAEKCSLFTTDDVWLAGLVKPEEPRALGAVMLSLMRDGIIRPTRRFKASAQATRHAAPIRVWESCLL